MASTGFIKLAEALPITGAGQILGSAVEPLQSEYILYAAVTGATGNVAVKLQHSADGINWLDAGTLAVISAGTPAAKLDITEFLFPRIRIDYSDSGNSSLTARLYHRPSK